MTTATAHDAFVAKIEELAAFAPATDTMWLCKGLRLISEGAKEVAGIAAAATSVVVLKPTAQQYMYANTYNKLAWNKIEHDDTGAAPASGNEYTVPDGFNRARMTIGVTINDASNYQQILGIAVARDGASDFGLGVNAAMIRKVGTMGYPQESLITPWFEVASGTKLSALAYTSPYARYTLYTQTFIQIELQ
jgi:hypothetical protein